MPATSHADDIVDLHFSAGTDAEIALNAGVEIDRHGRMTAIGRRLAMRGKPAGADVHAVGPRPEFGLRIVRRGLAVRLIGNEQFEDHLPRSLGAVGRRLHFHAFGGLADAASGQHALAFDLHHAGAAIAIGAVAGLGRIAQMRDVDAEALGDLPDGFVLARGNILAVEDKFDGLAFVCISHGLLAMWPFVVLHVA